jgi:beta-glucosidase
MVKRNKSRLSVERLEERCLLSSGIAGNGLSVLGHASPVAQPGVGEYWKERVADIQSELSQSDPGVLFVGDSITDWWRLFGASTWKADFQPLAAENIGVAANQTGQVLWELQQPYVRDKSPAAVVLMIGTNDISTGQSASQVASDIAAVVKQIQLDFPQAKILLMGILPRGTTTDPARAEIAQVNNLIAQLADGRQVSFIDIGRSFLQSDGSLAAGVTVDLAHPSAKGYQLWASAILQSLQQIVGAVPHTFHTVVAGPGSTASRTITTNHVVVNMNYTTGAGVTSTQSTYPPVSQSGAPATTSEAPGNVRTIGDSYASVAVAHAKPSQPWDGLWLF